MLNHVFRIAIVLLASVSLGRAQGEEPVQFNRDIRPLLSDRCYLCHGPSDQYSGLRLDSHEAATESVIVPGDADASDLLERIASDDPDMRMPPADSQKAAFTKKEIALIRRWINEGAKYEDHWAYIPPERSEPPVLDGDKWSGGPIDRFVYAQLNKQRLEPSPETDRVTLVRRVYLDVTGLPPTPEQVDEYLADERENAYELLVDRLLASPRHAERLATWWFDLVRFANTVGYHGDQEHRILPYRDYVLKSLHENKPFDEFTIEQLAGDLLEDPDMWQIVATGYNRVLQTSHEGGIQPGEYYAKMQADRVRNVSEVWLGSSMGCAECHDHKFDPLSQKDFYALGAFFADVDHYGSFVRPSRNETPTSRPPEMFAWTLPIYEEVKELDARIAKLEATLERIVPRNYQKTRDELTKLKKTRLELEAKYVPTLITKAKEPREIRVLPRGNWMDNSGEVVQPALPAVWQDPPKGDRRLSRLDLANWLVSKENPLTSRVTVNRVWALYFGHGLSRSLIDVGSQGQWPTHPELLDWLAVEFVDSEWNLRHLEKLILMSSAYRQSSQMRDELVDRDPENRLLARQSRWRLEAEPIRDGALQAAGLLVNQLGGHYSRPYQPDGYYAQLNFPERKYTASNGDDQYRRGVYVHWQRQFLHPWLQAFDAPTREECTAGRTISNTPSAALVLLNDPSFVEAARCLATRGLELEGELADRDRMAWLWRQATSRGPRSEEVDRLLQMLDAHREHFAKNKDEAEKLLAVGYSKPPESIDAVELAAWTSCSRTLLNLDETISRN